MTSKLSVVSAPKRPTGVHPVAALFPMMDEESLRELAASITENGLLQPIVLDGKGDVLDGRNRLAACEMAGVEPTFTTYEGDDPESYALAVNVERREMTKGQKAMVAVEALRITIIQRGSQSAVAEQVGVSKQLVTFANIVHEHTPDVVQAVIAGTIALKDAYDDARIKAKIQSVRDGRADALPADLRVLVETEVMTLEDAEERHEHNQRLAKVDDDLRSRIESDADGMDLDEAELVMRQRNERRLALLARVRAAIEQMRRMGGYPIPTWLESELDDEELNALRVCLEGLPVREELK